jgi:hypothetical protein
VRRATKVVEALADWGGVINSGWVERPHPPRRSLRDRREVREQADRGLGRRGPVNLAWHYFEH